MYFHVGQKRLCLSPSILFATKVTHFKYYKHSNESYTLDFWVGQLGCQGSSENLFSLDFKSISGFEVWYSLRIKLHNLYVYAREYSQCLQYLRYKSLFGTSKYSNACRILFFQDPPRENECRILFSCFIAHSGLELWFREKKSSWHMTFTQS